MLGRLGARALEAVELLGDGGAHTVGRVELVEPGAIFTDDVVVALAELLADRGELLAQEELALLLVDTLADVVADRLRDLQLGEMAAGPRHAPARLASTTSTARNMASRASVVELGPQGDRVGERAGVEVAPQQFGQAPRTPQFGDQLEDGAQLARRRSRSTATGAGRVGLRARRRRPRARRGRWRPHVHVSRPERSQPAHPSATSPCREPWRGPPSSCSSPPVSSRGSPFGGLDGTPELVGGKGMVTTAPGRITVDRWAMGRRERTPELVMHRRVPIRSLIDSDSGFLTPISDGGHPSRPRKGPSACSDDSRCGRLHATPRRRTRSCPAPRIRLPSSGASGSGPRPAASGCRDAHRRPRDRPGRRT